MNPPMPDPSAPSGNNLPIKGEKLKKTEPICMSQGKAIGIDYFWTLGQETIILIDIF